MASKLEALLLREASLEESVGDLKKALAPKPYLCNTSSGKSHAESPSNAPDFPPAWRAACGWHYSASMFSRAAQLPVGINSVALCERCLPLQRDDVRLTELSARAGDTSESASSASGSG